MDYFIEQIISYFTHMQCWRTYSDPFKGKVPIVQNENTPLLKIPALKITLLEVNKNYQQNVTTLSELKLGCTDFCIFIEMTKKQFYSILLFMADALMFKWYFTFVAGRG